MCPVICYALYGFHFLPVRDAIDLNAWARLNEITSEGHFLRTQKVRLGLGARRKNFETFLAHPHPPANLQTPLFLTISAHNPPQLHLDKCRSWTRDEYRESSPAITACYAPPGGRCKPNFVVTHRIGSKSKQSQSTTARAALHSRWANSEAVSAVSPYF